MIQYVSNKKNTTRKAIIELVSKSQVEGKFDLATFRKLKERQELILNDVHTDCVAITKAYEY